MNGGDIEKSGTPVVLLVIPLEFHYWYGFAVWFFGPFGPRKATERGSRAQVRGRIPFPGSQGPGGAPGFFESFGGCALFRSNRGVPPWSQLAKGGKKGPFGSKREEGGLGSQGEKRDLCVQRGKRALVPTGKIWTWAKFGKRTLVPKGRGGPFSKGEKGDPVPIGPEGHFPVPGSRKLTWFWVISDRCSLFFPKGKLVFTSGGRDFPRS